MPKSEFPKTESEGDSSSEEETENEAANENQEKVSDYEMQRLNRIEENKRRMEALGLHKMANSFMGSVQKTQKRDNDKKGKRKISDEDDDEYNPTQDDAEVSSSGEEDENDEEFSLSKKKVKKNTSTPKKQCPAQKPTFDSDFVEDDEALLQAIALSLQDSARVLDVRDSSSRQTSGAHPMNNAASKSPATYTSDATTDKRKDNLRIQNDSGRKRKKMITSRVQMTEDEMLIHFFHFDESGRGGFNLRDIQRLAVAHDFTWSEKEMADMIRCFDSDGDGKISFDDFRKIVCKCNMLKVSDEGVAG
ncbi:hypothetical protein ACS0TY_003605 [Phlomoides rotata]